jgi:hypothetical protein
MDGIAHSLMVLADVSTVGNDSKTGHAYRNANVMYEVGVALACRQSSEVLLIRDDRAPFLFDVSVVPHKHLDFADSAVALKLLSDELVLRLKEINRLEDSRVKLAIDSLTSQEHQLLSLSKKYGTKQLFWFKQEGLGVLAAVPRLLDKRLIRMVATSGQKAAFMLTEIGLAVANRLEALPKIEDPGDVSAPSVDGP